MSTIVVESLAGDKDAVTAIVPISEPTQFSLVGDGTATIRFNTGVVATLSPSKRTHKVFVAGDYTITISSSCNAVAVVTDPVLAATSSTQSTTAFDGESGFYTASDGVTSMYVEKVFDESNQTFVYRNRDGGALVEPGVDFFPLSTHDAESTQLQNADGIWDKYVVYSVDSSGNSIVSSTFFVDPSGVLSADPGDLVNVEEGQPASLQCWSWTDSTDPLNPIVYQYVGSMIFDHKLQEYIFKPLDAAAVHPTSVSDWELCAETTDKDNTSIQSFTWDDGGTIKSFEGYALFEDGVHIGWVSTNGGEAPTSAATVVNLESTTQVFSQDCYSYTDVTTDPNNTIFVQGYIKHKEGNEFAFRDTVNGVDIPLPLPDLRKVDCGLLPTPAEDTGVCKQHEITSGIIYTRQIEQSTFDAIVIDQTDQSWISNDVTLGLTYNASISGDLAPISKGTSTFWRTLNNTTIKNYPEFGAIPNGGTITYTFNDPLELSQIYMRVRAAIGQVFTVEVITSNGISLAQTSVTADSGDISLPAESGVTSVQLNITSSEPAINLWSIKLEPIVTISAGPYTVYDLDGQEVYIDEDGNTQAVPASAVGVDCPDDVVTVNAIGKSTEFERPWVNGEWACVLDSGGAKLSSDYEPRKYVTTVTDSDGNTTFSSLDLVYENNVDITSTLPAGWKLGACPSTEREGDPNYTTDIITALPEATFANQPVNGSERISIVNTSNAFLTIQTNLGTATMHPDSTIYYEVDQDDDPLIILTNISVVAGSTYANEEILINYTGRTV